MKTPAAILLVVLVLTSHGCGVEAPTSNGLIVDPDTRIRLRQDFDVELLYEVPESQGSWVAMAFDPKGRLIVSDQDDKGVFRVTLPREDDPGAKIHVESLAGFPWEPVAWGRRTVGGALGFLYAFDSLYMSSMKGFYRIRDTDGDDTYDEFTLLKKLYVGWEHSAHSIVKTADGTGLYLISGNHSRVPEGVTSLQPPVWGKDALLSPLPDPQGHATSIKAPGGWICRMSPDGEDWTMVASGLRNAVDLAINREGEMFTYDSDLEFDIGSPWYRPTRVNHVTSAAEFGWRTGSAKWPDYFADSNGSVIDIGPGSPTGMSFGHHSNFPAEYQDDLFLCDWTFGTIYTVELEEDGSSYTGRKQEFLSGTPLNIAAMRFGPDGHMYFVVGGRNTASKLYRVRYTGQSVSGKTRQLAAKQPLRDLRRTLEQFHDAGKGGAAAVERAWQHLGHADRGIRYAARLAIENQELVHWRDRVFDESDPRAAIRAVIALCRHGPEDVARRVFAKLGAIDFAALDRVDKLALLRAYSLCAIRLGSPTPGEKAAIAARLDPFYPAGDDALDTELCRLLSYIESPTVVGKTIALMRVTQTKSLAYDAEMLTRHEYGKAILETMANTPNGQNIWYAYCLRRVQAGWELADRKFYFGWLKNTLEKSGGKSFAGYIRAIRDDAIAHLPPAEAAAIAWLLGEVTTVDLAKLPTPSGPPVAWTVESARVLVADGLTGRDYDNGKRMFAAGRCIACHRIEGEGGYSGPDLGSVGSRYSSRDILVAICDPSDSVSEQYRASSIVFDDGERLYGRIIYHDDKEIAVAPDPYDFSHVTKRPAAKVASVEPSHLSMMPTGTINMMNADELKDLIAYLVAGGDKKHPAFKND
ncbi:MAG: c-type cytochrome [bacterium]|nr:c-type cytochrome [bacterium]